MYSHQLREKVYGAKCLETISNARFENLLTICLNAVFQNRFLMVIFWIAQISNWKEKQLLKKSRWYQRGDKLYLILCDGCYGDGWM